MDCSDLFMAAFAFSCKDLSPCQVRPVAMEVEQKQEHEVQGPTNQKTVTGSGTEDFEGDHGQRIGNS